MSMLLFFVSPEQAQQDVLCLTGEDARHIAGSLRMQPGERLTLSDGAGLMPVSYTHLGGEPEHSDEDFV